MEFLNNYYKDIFKEMTDVLDAMTEFTMPRKL